MTQPLRVLIADDSATARYLLSSLCRADSSLELVGEARDGQEAVDLTLRLHPDIVVMDVHMPVLDGFAATRQIMESRPTPVLAVTATHKPDDVAMAMASIEAGAVSVMQKPAGLDDPHPTHGATAFRRRVRNLAGVRVIRRYKRRPPRPEAATGQSPWDGAAVGIAASTGGPMALRDVLRALPADFPVPIAVVQHIAHGFLDGFAQWLATDLPLAVKVARQGEPFTAGAVYLAPDDHHLIVTAKGTLRLETGPPMNGFRPSASALFSSMAAAYGSHAVGVVLTGMGSDGLVGLQKLRDAGGCVLAQDPATAVAPSMPEVVISAGAAHIVAPLDTLATHLQKLCVRKESTR